MSKPHRILDIAWFPNGPVDYIKDFMVKLHHMELYVQNVLLISGQFAILKVTEWACKHVSIGGYIRLAKNQTSSHLIELSTGLFARRAVML
jgi:hypothetical protein